MQIPHRIIAMAFAAPLLVASCGGSSSSSSTSTTKTASGETRTTSADGTGADQAKVQACLKDKGIELPLGAQGGVPPAGGQQGSVPSLPDGVDINKLQEALQQCGGGGGGFPQNGANSQAFEAYQSCMTDHGVTIAAPGGSTPTSIDRSSPKFQAANETCSALLPQAATTTTGK